MRSHVIQLVLFTLIQPQFPRPLTFPFPISTKTYYSLDLKGISKSARVCKSILAAWPSWRLKSSRVRSSQGLTRLEPLSPGVPRAEHAQAEVSAHVQHYLSTFFFSYLLTPSCVIFFRCWSSPYSLISKSLLLYYFSLSVLRIKFPFMASSAFQNHIDKAVAFKFSGQ